MGFYPLVFNKSHLFFGINLKISNYSPVSAPKLAMRSMPTPASSHTTTLSNKVLYLRPSTPTMAKLKSNPTTEKSPSTSPKAGTSMPTKSYKKV
jgi:hypothetical protein